MSTAFDKAAQKQKQADDRASAAKPPALEPPFPWLRINFDADFFGVASEPTKPGESVE